jgi:UDP-GlcNAc:undecaprenyl-phosphate GlcNAc-1-phosphate transferase
VSFISGIILFLLGLFNGQELPAILSLALAGACLGFLRYNSKPASIFLGDTGSLFLGFMLGSIALMETKTISSRFSNLFIFPLILGVPIFDTSLATILRIKRGKPVYLPDKSNLTFRLFGLGFTERKIVFIEYLMAAVLGFSGILLLKINSIIGYFVLVIIFTTLFLFGYRLGAVPYEEKAELRTYNFERALKNKSERQAA